MVQVLESTADARPKKVRFSFATTLEDESLRWMLYDDGRYVPYVLPATGESEAIEAVDFSIFPAFDGARAIGGGIARVADHE